MLRWLRIMSVSGVIGALSCLTVSASAQEDEWGHDADEDTGDEESESTDDSETSDEGEGDEEGEESRADNTDSTDPAKIDADSEKDKVDSPYEKPGQAYYFAGLRYRGIIVPQFMMNLFASGGTNVYVNAVGPEVSIRKDGFESIFGLWWAGYYMPRTPFKGINDKRVAYELIKSEMNVLYLTADFMWSTPLSEMFAINYGMGAGFGIVWGDLRRNQATPPVNDLRADPDEFVKCQAEFVPATIDSRGRFYCDDDNKHYGRYSEDNWFQGGQKPVIFPWFALQTGIRFKPHKRVASRLDLGWGLTGPFFGLSAAYGF